MAKINIPPNWELTTIGNVCDHPQYGYTTKAANSGDTLFLRTTDITSGKLDWGTVPYCAENPSDSDKYQLHDGDIVISRAGSVGFSFLIKNPPKAAFASYLIRFKPYVDREYFSIFLKSPNYWKAISGSKVGIAVGNVNAKKLSAINFPLPPLPEQKRIVTKIEELFSELDAGEESFKQARKQLGIYRQSLLKQAFEGKLTEAWRKANPDQLEAPDQLLARMGVIRADNIKPHICEHWVMVDLESLTEYVTSGSRGWAKYYADKGSLFIRAQNLKTDSLQYDDIAYVALPQKAEGTRTLTKKGDLLITITGANVTKAAYVELDLGVAYVSQHVALCRLHDPKLAQFLHLYVISPAGGRRDLEKAAYGAGKPGLNLTNVRSLSIPLCSLPEQQKIVRLLGAQFTVIEQNEREIDAALKRSAALRQSILKRAFSGQLVPQDPSDEPASELLKRIQQERAEREAKVKAKVKAIKKPRKKTARKRKT